MKQLKMVGLAAVILAAVGLLAYSVWGGRTWPGWSGWGWTCPGERWCRRWIPTAASTATGIPL